MNKSESIKSIAKALASFQSEVQNPKNTADNPFFKSKYAPLQDILNDVRPLLAKHGLSVIQSPQGDGKNIVIETLLLHESGEWIEPEPLTLQADKANAQGAGSAITYGRRYALSAILGISSEDDDDGNYASETKPNANRISNGQQKYEQPKSISNKQVGLIKSQVKKISSAKSKTDEEVYQALNVEDVTKLTSQQASQAIKTLNKWVDQLEEQPPQRNGPVDPNDEELPF